MRACGIIVLVVVALVSCQKAVDMPPAPAVQSRGPMLDYEPEGDVPSFERLHEKVFEPHWL